MARTMTRAFVAAILRSAAREGVGQVKALQKSNPYKLHKVTASATVELASGPTRESCEVLRDALTDDPEDPRFVIVRVG